jgi:hypothetical protein
MSLKIEKPGDLEKIVKYMTKAVKQPRDGFKNHDSWWDLKDLIAHFENDNGFDYKVRVKIWEDFGGFEMKKTKENILKLLEAIIAANKKPIVLILGNISFDHFSEKELKLFRGNAEKKALVHEILGIIKCETYEQAERIGEDLCNELLAYLIPSAFDGDIAFECPLELKAM